MLNWEGRKGEELCPLLGCFLSEKLFSFSAPSFFPFSFVAVAPLQHLHTPSPWEGNGDLRGGGGNGTTQHGWLATPTISFFLFLPCFCCHLLLVCLFGGHHSSGQENNCTDKTSTGYMQLIQQHHLLGASSLGLKGSIPE